MNRKAFSLLEVTIASVVLAVAILSLVAAITVNFRLRRANDETMLAINAANNWIQQALALPLLFANLNNALPIPSNFSVPGLNYINGDSTVPHGVVQYINITPVIPTATYVEIVVTVRWTGVDGDRQITLQTQRFRTFEDAAAEVLAGFGS